MTMPADPRVDTFRDIVGAMEAHPELRDAVRVQVLGEGFLGRLEGDVAELKAGQARLEVRLDRLEGDVAELKAGQARLEVRLDRLEGDVAELKAGQARLEARQDRMETDIAELKAGQARLEARQDRMEADIAELKAGQARLEARQDRMEADIAELKAGQARLEARQDRMEADIAEIKVRQSRMEGDIADLKSGQREIRGMLGNMIGTDYERQVARTAGRIARRNMGLTEAEVVHGVTLRNGNAVYLLADRAEANGIITPDENDDLVMADIVVYDESTGVYALAEVSVTVGEYDVVRARRRADILAKVTSAEVRAAVVGAFFHDDDYLAVAERDGVVVVTQQQRSGPLV